MPSPFLLTAFEPSGAKNLVVELSVGGRATIGRLPSNTIAVVWDREVSREHAVARLEGHLLKVACLPTTRNPLIYQGEAGTEFMIRGGQSFQIGQTKFQFDAPLPEVEISESPALDNPDGFEEVGFAANDVQKFDFENMATQMSLLRDLPEMISSAKSDIELAQMLCKLLLSAIPQALAVAVGVYDSSSIEVLKNYTATPTNPIKPKMMRVEVRDDYDGRFMPSRRLLGRAFAQGDATVHIWAGGGNSGVFTMADNLDWAFCVPVSGEACAGWCLYISGQGAKSGALITKDDLEPDVRFTQLLTKFISSIRQVRVLQEKHTQMSSFFSPKVIENLTGSADILAPSERDITVLFCDVRGFSRKSEKYKDDLLYLLSCVREALGVMTDGILQFDGAIADFQGDAALGFWGWPQSLAEGAIPACLAALAVQDEFLHPERHAGRLDGFTVGIGVAHGRAIAGQIGTQQQAKIGVFGPVVNQGSRIEGLTRHFGVSICLDERAAEFARKLPPEKARVRRLARIRPKGMDTSITVSQLLPPYRNVGTSSDGSFDVQAPTMGNLNRASIERNLEQLDANNIPDDHIQDYETVLDMIISGNWEIALPLLNALPEEEPRDFLLEQMKRYDNKVPTNWDGSFSMSEK